MKNTRYEGLDELRAIAALIIIPGHIEQFKELFGMPHYYWFPIPGKLGVILFFVLSGFLITTLLFRERKRNNNINLKYFYLRRILRIWPLYFLIMGLSILLLNQMSLLQVPMLSQRAIDSLDLTSLIFIFLILPNLLIPPVHPIPYAAHTWSIGIEEQFYLLQPFLVKFIKDYRVQITILLLVVFSKELVSYCFDDINSKLYNRAVSQLVYFGSIAIGCIIGILHVKRPAITKFAIHNKYVQLFAYSLFLLFLLIIYIEQKETAVDFRLHAVIFAILVLNIATNPSSVVKIKSKLFSYLGKISYGIYMYHPISIGLTIAITSTILDTSSNEIVLNISMYLITFALAIIIPAVSFKYFEDNFLKLKERYKQ